MAYKGKCKYCKKEIEGLTSGQVEHLLQQHTIARHIEKVKFETKEKKPEKIIVVNEKDKPTPNMGEIVCKSCNTKNEAEVDFCKKCGEKPLEEPETDWGFG